jgi:hypothetical protein
LSFVFFLPSSFPAPQPPNGGDPSLFFFSCTPLPAPCSPLYALCFTLIFTFFFYLLLLTQCSGCINLCCHKGRYPACHHP